MTKKYDLVVYIGRFQPFHTAHKKVIEKALSLSDKTLILIGSSYLPRTYKNPFSYIERHDMIYNEWNTNSGTLFVEYLTDNMYNDNEWVQQVQSIVQEYSDGRIAIMGYNKDESSYYLRMFPQWDFVDSGEFDPLNATDIRDLYFRPDCNMKYIQNVVPSSTFEFLEKFKETDEYQQIIRERQFIEKYKKQYEHLPYAPVFVTADAIVVSSGHVLVVKRKAEPGKGLLAVPGGFLNAKTDKSLQQAALRELREETKIDVPDKVLRGSIKNDHVFDAIERSARGRTITHAFYIELPPGDLPKVKGSDDAEKAFWVPLSEIRSDNMFDDHYDMIKYFTRT